MAQFNDPGKFESQSGSGEKWNRLVSVSDAKLETQRPMIQMLARCIIDNIIDNLISTAEDRGGQERAHNHFIRRPAVLGLHLKY